MVEEPPVSDWCFPHLTDQIDHFLDHPDADLSMWYAVEGVYGTDATQETRATVDHAD